MKFLVPIVFLGVLVLSVLLGALWWNNAVGAPSSNSEEVRFTINRGASAETIGTNLKKSGLIKDPFAFKVYLSSRGLVAKIPPGQFRIPQNLTLAEVIELLMEGPVELWVTIPEGLRTEQIPPLFIDAFELTPANAQTFEQEFITASIDMEGFLYPDTYLFPPEATATQVVMLLRSTFDKKFAPGAELDEVGLTLDEVVTLASIIERETKTPQERPVVAGIYFNRLSADWPLQADATLQYILGDEDAWWTPPTAVDKELNSPYNTYKFPGLPPAPIANPGLTSLEAVVNPEDTNYWFYLHDSDGVIHYAETLLEHNQNVQRYLR